MLVPPSNVKLNTGPVDCPETSVASYQRAPPNSSEEQSPQLRGCESVKSRKYRYSPHNDVSVNDRPLIRQWSHKIILYYNIYHCVTFAYSIQYSAMLYGARGGVVVKALRYKRQVAGSILDGVIGIFQ